MRSYAQLNKSSILFFDFGKIGSYHRIEMHSKTKSFISALSIGFLDNFGQSLVFILFAPLILNSEYGFFSKEVSLGAKNILLGLLIGIFPMLLFFGAPFWGDIGDHWGRRKALLFTVFGTFLGHLLSAFSISVQSYLFLLISRAIAGFFSGNASICMATISDLSTHETKARNLGILTVFWGMGFILSMLAGGFLSDPTIVSYFRPELPFYFAAGLTLVGLLIVKFLFVETHKPRSEIQFGWMKSIDEIKKALQMAQMRPFLYILFFWSMGWFLNFQWFTPVSLERFQVTQEIVSSHLAIFGIFWIVGGIVINPWVVKRFSSFSLATGSILIVASFILLLSMSSRFAMFSLLFTVTALASPVSLSNLLNLLSASAPPAIQGKTMGFSQSFFALSGILVPIIGGILANLSIKAIYPISSLFLFFAVVLLVRKKR